jgi:thiamine-phosphate pyrophosphorylase
MRLPFDVYLITPELPWREVVVKVELALSVAPQNRVGVQLRANDASANERRELGRALRSITHRAHAALLVNRDLELACEVEADGVQLPERGPTVAEARAQLGPSALIGASRHDRAGLLAAEAQGADFALLSPVFAVAGKSAAMGVAAFASHVSVTQLPVLALGGVTAENASSLLRAGAAGVAVMREVLAQPRPEVALTRLLSALALGESP